MKTHTIRLYVKDPDEFGELISRLGLNDDDSGKYRTHIEFAEYATLELTFDENLKVVEGRILPVKR